MPDDICNHHINPLPIRFGERKLFLWKTKAYVESIWQDMPYSDGIGHVPLVAYIRPYDIKINR